MPRGFGAECGTCQALLLKVRGSVPAQGSACVCRGGPGVSPGLRTLTGFPIILQVPTHVLELNQSITGSRALEIAARRPESRTHSRVARTPHVPRSWALAKRWCGGRRCVRFLPPAPSLTGPPDLRVPERLLLYRLPCPQLRPSLPVSQRWANAPRHCLVLWVWAGLGPDPALAPPPGCVSEVVTSNECSRGRWARVSEQALRLLHVPALRGHRDGASPTAVGMSPQCQGRDPPATCWKDPSCKDPSIAPYLVVPTTPRYPPMPQPGRLAEPGCVGSGQALDNQSPEGWPGVLLADGRMPRSTSGW